MSYKYVVRQTDTPRPARPEREYMPRTPRWGKRETAASRKAQEQWKKDTQLWKIESGQIAYTDVRGSQHSPRHGTIEGTIPGFRGNAVEAQEHAFNIQKESGAVRRKNTTAQTSDRDSLSHRGPAYERRKRTSKRGSLRIDR